MNKFTVIASVVFLYIVVDAVMLGAFGKELPIPIFKMIKGVGGNTGGNSLSQPPKPQVSSGANPNPILAHFTNKMPI